LVIDFSNEFQTVGAECQKARFANSVLVNGLISSGLCIFKCSKTTS